MRQARAESGYRMNAAALAPRYRSYELPWSLDNEVERTYRFRQKIALAVVLVVGLIIALIPRVEAPRSSPADLPERVVQLIVETPIPPPPPPPPPPEVKPQQVSPQPSRVPNKTPVDTQQRVRNTGMLALQDELAELREPQDFEQPKPEDVDQGTEVRSERNLITSTVGSASSGINTAAMSRGFGGGAGAIGTHTTTTVAAPSSVVGKGRGGAVQRGGSGKASRSREEIETVFDRNKGALYALYTRALRENPELQGKLVLELTIAPSGDITLCRVVSSELKDPDLEAKIVSRVRLFKFEAKDVASMTATKLLEFFPA